MYELEDAGAVARVKWLGESPHSARSLVALPVDPEEREDARQLSDFVRELLEVTARPIAEVRAECRRAGFEVSDRTLRRARQAIGAEPERHGFGPGAVVWWRLPGRPIVDTNPIPDTPEDVSTMGNLSAMDPDATARDAMREGA